MNAEQYRRVMGMDMIREMQRLENARPCAWDINSEPAKPQKQKPECEWRNSSDAGFPALSTIIGTP